MKISLVQENKLSNVMKQNLNKVSFVFSFLYIMEEIYLEIAI